MKADRSIKRLEPFTPAAPSRRPFIIPRVRRRPLRPAEALMKFPHAPLACNRECPIHPTKTTSLRHTIRHSSPVKLPTLLMLLLLAIAAHSEPEVVNTTPKLENLNAQIAVNANDAQAISN